MSPKNRSREKVNRSAHKVLVTGAMGFIGSNLTRKLNKDYPELELTLIDSLINGYPYEDIINNNRFLNIDVTNYLDLDSIDTEFTHIIHLAALGSVPRSLSNPRATFLNNVVGTQNICDMAKKNNARLLFASSSSIFGDIPNTSRTESTPRNPTSPYGFSKVHGEQIIESYSKSFGLRACAMRFFNVFGPYQNLRNEYSAVIPRIINASLSSTVFEIHGSGEQTRDFTYIDNLVKVIISLLKIGDSLPEKINIAWGKKISINSIVDIVNKITQEKLKIIHQPVRAGDIFESKNESNLLKILFPEIEPTLLNEAITSTYEWTKMVDKKIYYG
jgi:UDP-glucose 4-epimerase